MCFAGRDDVPARDALAKLLDFGWQAREPQEGLGVLYLPAIHKGSAKDNYSERLLENNGILSTFLQHPRIQPKVKPFSRSIKFEDDREISVQVMESKTKLAYVSDFRKKLFTAKGKRKASVGLSQYIMPGATARHGGERSWTGSVARTLPLFFAPIGCFFLRAQQFSWIVVVPDIVDLQGFASTLSVVSVGWKEAEVRSLEDAGLRVAVAYRTQTTQRRLPLRVLEVIRVRNVAWNPRQKVRSHFCRLHPVQNELEEFEIVLRHLSNRYRAKKDERGHFCGGADPPRANRGQLGTGPLLVPLAVRHSQG